METVKIKLKYPVAFDGVVRDELVMRRPKVRDMRAASKQAQGDDELREIVCSRRWPTSRPTTSKEWTWSITTPCSVRTNPFDPFVRLPIETVKALARRLMKEYGVQPQSVDDMTIDDVLWWLTD
ncbi:hypothetical protein BURMUCF1_2008 [Burkholderia multivorans ATCC BAA-247]|uniref:phage tail assembly protein n=1 Tax=Burkholderia multivorans TaxID=87883 RepID=UPI000277D392|nr:phage tail assembly protein [Burkholderia multivorans]EJO54755.1 hypothetical protein BURMUCF1_2008 [Burkholderia multivorans ATCC BAA-247]